MTSYGTTIKYKIRMSAPENSDGQKSTIKPDLILVGANMTLAHTSLQQPLSDNTLFSNTIDLIESKFSHLHTGSSATREQFMIALASLSEIKVRATYYNKVHPSALVEFTFDAAVDFSENLTTEATAAERCYCPPNFRGYSCESCEYGFYKASEKCWMIKIKF